MDTLHFTSMCRESVSRLLTGTLCVLALSLGACSSSSPAAAACPQDLPAACPSNAPSYQLDVAPIIADRCFLCHSPEGTASERNFVGYSAIYASRGAILDQVYACNMPPSGAVALSITERAKLLAWLVCGAPDN